MANRFCFTIKLGLHAWTGSGARVDWKRRTRGLEAAHAWTGSGARVNRKRRTREPDNGCRIGLWPPPRHWRLQAASAAKHPKNAETRFIASPRMSCPPAVRLHGSFGLLNAGLQSTWFWCTINLILVYNQLDFTAWSTCFFKKICVESFTPSQSMQLIDMQLLMVKDATVGIFHCLSRVFLYNIRQHRGLRWNILCGACSSCSSFHAPCETSLILTMKLFFERFPRLAHRVYKSVK